MAGNSNLPSSAYTKVVSTTLLALYIPKSSDLAKNFYVNTGWSNEDWSYSRISIGPIHINHLVKYY